MWISRSELKELHLRIDVLSERVSRNNEIIVYPPVTAIWPLTPDGLPKVKISRVIDAILAHLKLELQIEHYPSEPGVKLVKKA